MRKVIRKLFFSKFNKFLIGGTFTFAIKLGVAFLLTEILNMWYFASYIISLAIIVMFSFVYNAYVTFKVTHNKKQNFIKYIIVLLAFAGIDALSVKVLTDIFNVYYLISIIAVTIVLFVLKFFTYDKIVFIKKDNQTQINGIVSPLLQLLRIKNAKPFIKGKSFLDIGCSLGEIIPYLPKNAGYVGIEGNKDYFKNAKRKHPAHRFLNFYLDKQNVGRLSSEGKFDTIIALAVIEHMDEPWKVLKELKKFLKKKGRVIISTPSKHSELILRLGSKIGLFTSEMHEHKKQFTKKELAKNAKNAGYNIIHYHSFELGMNHLIVLEKP